MAQGHPGRVRLAEHIAPPGKQDAGPGIGIATLARHHAAAATRLALYADVSTTNQITTTLSSDKNTAALPMSLARFAN